MLNRAFSLLSIKQVDDDARVLTGMATTPTPDRLHDVVEPDGAQFKLPMPLLWQHDASQPIGHVTDARVSKGGIEIVAKIARIAEPGRLKDRLDEAWQSMKTGLVSGLSIGFKPIESEFNKETKGYRFTKWDFLELSAVTIPANAECTIATVKSVDAALRAAPGRDKPRSVVHLNPPGASGQSEPKSAQEGTMKTIAEQIMALEAKRAASAARMEAVMQKTLDEDRTSDASEQEEFDTLSGDVDAIDKDLVRLRKIENAKAFAARPIAKAETAHEGAAMRSNVVVRSQPTLPEGIEGARALKCMLVQKMDGGKLTDIAGEMYGTESNVYGAFTKANVPGGTTISPNWASGLIGVEAGPVADFAEYLRARTIIGRFGTGGIPALRAVPFYSPLITQTGGGAGYWVGEGKAKPLTSFNFTRTHLSPLKVANITVLTQENIRFSDPKSDMIVRDQLAAALIDRLDTDFIDPTKVAVTNVSPASITNGAAAIASAAGTDAPSVILDIRSLMAKFTKANNPPSTGVFVMSSVAAAALASMLNPLGQPSFPTVTAQGGTLFGLPVIVSDHAGTNCTLVNATDVYLADDGQISVDASEEASLEMSDAPTGDSGAPTAASMVSMFQTNSVAIRAERVINWARRRTTSVAYITGVDWGGAVNSA